MTKILYVRHGQNEDNLAGVLNGHRDLPLTNLGREQALGAAEKLRGEKINIVYCSPLLRARETAEIIVDQLGLSEPNVDELLIERDFGILSGKPKTDIPKYCQEFIQVKEKKFFLDGEGVESFEAVYDRAKKFLEQMRLKHPEETVLVVAHGDIGKMLRAVWFDWGWRQGIEAENIENCDVVRLS